MISLPLSLDGFLSRLEDANKERFDDENWSFNEGQRAAITSADGPLCITAGPGSGKTEVLISRALRLLLVDGVAPKSILITTFTEKAAQNLEERIADRLSTLGFEDEVDANALRIGTLHSLCNDLIQEYRYPEYANVELLDADGQQLFMYDNCDFVDYVRGRGLDVEEWETISEEELSGDEWRFFKPMLGWGISDQYGPNKWQATSGAATLLDRVSQYRVDTAAMQSQAPDQWKACAEGLEKYRKTLKDNSRCDFSRLLEIFIEFIGSESGRRLVDGDEERNRPPLTHVLVDEYQDTNPLQQELYFRLAEELDQPNITVVGDDDQALYRFRGGTVECLIQFPTRAAERFDTSVETVQLRHNYRSTKDVVDWCNRYLDDYPLMQVPGARAPDKDSMLVGRDDTAGRPSVKALLEGSSDSVAAEKAAELVEQLYERDYITDYSQVAFLFKSTKETPKNAGPYVAALRERGIPVYNPRNKAFLKQTEIKFALGALLHCIDPGLDGAETINIRGRTRTQLNTWYDSYEEFVDEFDAGELAAYVETRREALEDAEGGDSLGLTLLDLFYRVLSFEPFQTWIESPDYPAPGNRLGQLSNLFDSFMSVSGAHRLSKSTRSETVSTRFLRQFYWQFCGYLEASDFDEPEDPYNQIPEGFVQVMTVHQAKGLEFPVVFTSDLDSEPWMSGTYWIEEQVRPYASINPSGTETERAERDELRRFFVAYSRAEEDLILLDNEGAPTTLSLGYSEDNDELTTEWFDDERRVRTPDDFFETAQESVGSHNSTTLKRRYSITGDVLAYRRCKRQYGYYNEMSFVPDHATQLFFGRVVHETLDRAHRHYSGEIDGVSAGTIPSDGDIETYFREVASSLKAQNIRPMSQKAEETALKYIQRFNRREGADLYPRVVDTEHHLQSNRGEFVLEGIVDVLLGDEDGREIWDYKAGSRPDSDKELDDYRAQLNTYAELYAYQRGEYPDRGVIYFVGEDSRDDAMFELSFSTGEVEDALTAFDETVRDIEQSRSTRDWFGISQMEAPSEGTCTECDIRWNCPARPQFKRNLN
ncbi:MULTISPECIES: ATP-dependent DNA helicase [Haloferax]|uniref:DNA 3'-5' helicase n=2 Tax=Haloferax TaxID=2251 RepID=A0A6G1Z7E1_9EURY|nr:MULTISPECIES: ATP-dependent DNA helicase [Haloferax]KAB1184764.1 ATP-dependent helicase [Haloferax sp. CBA1149]MRW82395.1 AAA family ATPase [Haloferax marinisediminis]